MRHQKRLLIAFLACLFVCSQASALDLSKLNPFTKNKPLGRITGTIKAPDVGASLRKMNNGTQKVWSGTKDILFPWVSKPKTPKIQAPTGTKRIYPASARPNS